jgi:hypothetical protein
MLALHVWANALERHWPIEAKGGLLSRHWALVVCQLLALLPFIGDGLARGQPTPVLLLLTVAFLALYMEKRVVPASFAFSLAVAIKIFPLVLVVIPLLRRDWGFLARSAGWGFLLLIAIPAVCIGPATMVDLYRAMFADHLFGIVSGAMSPEIASQVAPGGFSSIGVGALVARIAAGDAFYSAALPQWASHFQFLFNALTVVAVASAGRGGFWNGRGAQPTAGYPLLVVGAMLSGMVPLMISSAGPQYVTMTVPLTAVMLVQGWQQKGAQVLTGTMVAWTVAAWFSMLALEMPWPWLKLVGPMTWVLLLLIPPGLSLLADLSQPNAAVTVARPA